MNSRESDDPRATMMEARESMREQAGQRGDGPGGRGAGGGMGTKGGIAGGRGGTGSGRSGMGGGRSGMAGGRSGMGGGRGGMGGGKGGGMGDNPGKQGDLGDPLQQLLGGWDLLLVAQNTTSIELMDSRDVAITLPLDGSPTVREVNGRQFSDHASWREGVLQVISRDENGLTIVRSYQLSDDTQQIRVRVDITFPTSEEPTSFLLVYDAA
ncbi:MAG: hypothetical protein ABIF77_09940 [bacterium]